MKKEKFFRIIFSVIILLFSLAALLRFSPIETGLLQSIIKPDSIENQELLKLSELSSSAVNVIFEGNNFEENTELKEKFTENFNFKNIGIKDENFSNILNIYKNLPENFLTPKTRTLLEKKDYDTVSKNSLKILYNPLGIYLQTPDKDPYLLATDFVMSLNNGTFSNLDGAEFEGKTYSLLQLNLKNNGEDEIAALISLQKNLNRENEGKIYLTGVPIHSTLTAQKSTLEINLICLISTLALILLCKFYFKSLKILFPISSSILFGMFFGYLATTAFLGKIHILTFVFSTTLIGISLDYSLHYFLDGRGEDFVKNLTSAMITTVLTFFMLLFSGVEILKQIAIFTGAGLVGVYAFVVLFLPMFKGFHFEKTNSVKLPNLNCYKKFILPVVILTIIAGLGRLSFNDNITNLYNPSKELLYSEMIYKKAFNMPEVSFVTAHGENFNSIIKKEEEISSVLDKKGIEYYSLSKFFPSARTQTLNRKLVRDLYFSNLDKYANFLDKKQHESLKDQVEKYLIKDFSTENSDFIKKFMLDENTSFMAVLNAENFEMPAIDGIRYINISKSITKELEDFRKLCLRILPFMFLLLFGLLVLIFKFKKAIKVILPPLLGTCFAVSVLSIFNQPLNMFNILAMFLIVGFSLDYSIFRSSGGKNSKDAVLISFISSAFSFLMLSFTSFKLISSLGLVLFLGISTSYILSLVLIGVNDETDIM